MSQRRIILAFAFSGPAFLAGAYAAIALSPDSPGFDPLWWMAPLSGLVAAWFTCWLVVGLRPRPFQYVIGAFLLLSAVRFVPELELVRAFGATDPMVAAAFVSLVLSPAFLWHMFVNYRVPMKDAKIATSVSGFAIVFSASAVAVQHWRVHNPALPDAMIAAVNQSMSVSAAQFPLDHSLLQAERLPTPCRVPYSKAFAPLANVDGSGPTPMFFAVDNLQDHMKWALTYAIRDARGKWHCYSSVGRSVVLPKSAGIALPAAVYLGLSAEAGGQGSPETLRLGSCATKAACKREGV